MDGFARATGEDGRIRIIAFGIVWPLIPTTFAIGRFVAQEAPLNDIFWVRCVGLCAGGVERCTVNKIAHAERIGRPFVLASGAIRAPVTDLL